VTNRDAYALLLVVALIWAGNFPLAKLGLAELGPLTLAAARALIAAPLLALASRVLEGPLPPLARRDWTAAIVLALTGFVGNLLGLSRLMLGEPIRWYHLVGAGGVIAGVALTTRR
jgi:drug/metabolite transporter (DMT)-like permease